MTPETRRLIIEEVASSDEQLFTRTELDKMLALYGELVAKAFGEYLQKHPLEAQRLTIDELFPHFIEEYTSKQDDTGKTKGIERPH